MVTEDTCVYGITWESKQNKKRSPRADPQGTLTFKGLAQEDDPAKKEQLEAEWDKRQPGSQSCRGDAVREQRLPLFYQSAAVGEASLSRDRAANKELIHCSSPLFHNLQEKC